MNLDQNTEKWLVNVLDASSIETITVLQGGISSDMYHIIVLDLYGNKKEAILRQITNEIWLAEEPDMLQQEKEVLKICETLLLNTPRFIAADDAVSCPYPSLLMTKLPGEIDLIPWDQQSWLNQMVLSLTSIHESDIKKFPYIYNSYHDPSRVQAPEWSEHKEKWEEIIHYARTKSVPQEDSYVFIHRDYHPNNILWTDGKITGIVDWINACIGPAGADVGHCRWNLAMIYDVMAADNFLQLYIANRPQFTYDVYWDIISLLDVLTDPAEVYEGWRLFGFANYTASTMEDKMDQYMCSLWRRMNHDK